MAQDPNYGLYREHHATPAPRYPSGIGVGSLEERTWSALAHLSIFLNLFTGFLGPIVVFAIWMVYRGRSEWVAFHAMRSLWYQVTWLVILTVGWTVTGILTPVMVVLSLVPFVHTVYAAYKASRGANYRYLWAADLLKGGH